MGLLTMSRSGTGGNTVFLHLFLDALLLQPCFPDCAYTRFVLSAKTVQSADTSVVLTDSPRRSIGMDPGRFQSVRWREQLRLVACICVPWAWRGRDVPSERV